MSERVCEGKKVYLRPARVRDAGHITRWKSDPLVVEMALGGEARVSFEEQEEDLARAVSSESELYFVVVIQAEETPIGYVRVNWIDSEHRFAWLRFALGERRGEGFGRDAVSAAVAHLFALGAHRVEAEAYETNRASRRLLERIGFVVEGVKREAHRTPEGYVDMFCFGILAPEAPS